MATVILAATADAAGVHRQPPAEAEVTYLDRDLLKCCVWFHVRAFHCNFIHLFRLQSIHSRPPPSSSSSPLKQKKNIRTRRKKQWDLGSLPLNGDVHLPNDERATECTSAYSSYSLMWQRVVLLCVAVDHKILEKPSEFGTIAYPVPHISIDKIYSSIRLSVGATKILQNRKSANRVLICWKRRGAECWGTVSRSRVVELKRPSKIYNAGT